MKRREFITLQLGWTEGGNLRIDYRWAAADPDRVRDYAAELAGLAPDVILAHAPAALKALQREARTVPIVFVMVPVPVAAAVNQHCRSRGSLKEARHS